MIGFHGTVIMNHDVVDIFLLKVANVNVHFESFFGCLNKVCSQLKFERLIQTI